MALRRVLSGLTALMVLYAALFCACPRVAAAAVGAAKPAAQASHEGCHGHERPAGSETPGEAPQPHRHGGGCDCSGAEGVLEAPPAPTVAAALPPVLPPAAVSLVDRLLAEARSATTTPSLLVGDARPPGAGAGGSLLRQRCALNL